MFEITAPGADVEDDGEGRADSASTPAAPASCDTRNSEWSYD
jgi:hypothetical protein